MNEHKATINKTNGKRYEYDYMRIYLPTGNLTEFVEEEMRRLGIAKASTYFAHLVEQRRREYESSQL